MTYVSLHNHSDYSNIRGLDSINTLEQLIEKGLELGLYGLAITDHDVLSGHIKATQIHEKLDPDKKMKLLLGNEIYISREGLVKENYEKGEKLFHFLLLALNETGHKQLREISTRAWDRSFFLNVPRTPTYESDLKEIIGQNKGNVVATTACLAGFPGTFWEIYKDKSVDMIDKKMKELEEIFGVGNFFLEIQPSALEKHRAFNSFMIKNFWGKYPFVFTTDSHYGELEDAKYHEQFLQSANKSRDVSSFYSNNYVMSIEEITQAFNYIEPEKIEEMAQNTISIGDRAEFYTLENEQIVPTVPVDYSRDGIPSLKEYLKSLTDKEYEYINKYLDTDDIYDIDFIQKVFIGFQNRFRDDQDIDTYLSRIDIELSEVWETSVQIHQPLSKYFTTMAKMIDIIWTEGDSLVGVSRGSAAGFLINYYLGITQIDPLDQPLPMPHWRFIHKDRPGLPDIDIDTEGDKRNRVFFKVQEYFQSIGGDIINVSTFGTQKAKAALRTAARALDIEDDVISFIIAMIPNERGFDWNLTECMYGDGERKALPAFKTEMSKHKDLWNLAYRIEDLITSLSVHASGVVAVNEAITEHNSVMKTSRGIRVTAFNLEDTEYAGGIKYDFLTINALDKIRTTMNLLLEDGRLDWYDDLRSTYDHYLLPANLDYDSPEMWQMVAEGKIVDLFQFDTQVGTQAVRLIRPTNIAELSVANSVMRLMPEGDGDLPLNIYADYKHDIRSWYHEVRNAGLSEAEIKILEEHLLPLSGVADSQESAMMLVMDEKITGFSVTEANSLRRAIARKEAETMRMTEKMFYEKGKELGTSKKLLDYVWNVQIYRQAGYSFSVLHTMGYSTIALQEMNLAYRFPVIYWNTASLSVNAGAINEEDYHALIEDGIVEIDEDDEDYSRKTGKVQYGKIASAIEKFRKDLGLKVALPDINRARFGFVPDAYRNEVLFGLKGLTRIGDKLIETIIENRPYDSLWHFLEKLNKPGKTQVSKDRVVILIKAGAFDNITDKSREELLEEFILSVADQKKRLTLQNAAKLIELDLLPESLDYQIRVYNYTKYIRRSRDENRDYILDDIAQEFFYENSYNIDKITVKPVNGQNLSILSSSYWDSVYNSEMDYIRLYISKNHDELLTKMNKILFQEEYDKYAKGTRLTWELESLGFYHEAHELEGVAETFPELVKISTLDEIDDMKVIGEFLIKGKRIPKYEIYHIIGTVLDKDKQKHTIVFSTPNGVIDVKMYRGQFAILDKVDFKINDEGKKEVIQDSFLKKGTYLLISGIKDGDVFRPKVYKEHGIDPILMFEVEDGKFKVAHEKK